MNLKQYLLLLRKDAAQAAPSPQVSSYAPKVLALLPYLYYQLNDAEGTTVALDSSGNSIHGTYVNATPGAIGIGDTNTAASFDGTGDFITIGNIAAAFDGDVGSMLIWGKTSDWATATIRYLGIVSSDATDYIRIRKSGANAMSFQRVGDGGSMSVNGAVSLTDEWFSAIITWDIAVPRLRGIVNGVQLGQSTSPADPFVGTPIASRSTIGAFTNTGANSWLGSIAHMALWDRVLSTEEIATIATL